MSGLSTFNNRLVVPKDKYLKQFGAHVRSLRLARGLTQQQLGANMNKEFQAIQRIERGGVNPSLYVIYELSLGLGIDQMELLDFRTSKKN